MPKPPRSARRTSTGDQLLEAASRILGERHVVDLSLSEIAETSGLNSSLIKYHFGSKDGLLLALARRDATVALARLDRLVDMDIPPEQKIRLHIAGVINTYAKYPYLNRLIHNLLTNSDENITQEIASFFVQPLVNSQVKMLDEGVKLGVFRPVDSMFFYYSIVGACDHLFFGRYSRKFVFDAGEITSKIREGYVEFVCDMALKTLRKE